MEILFVDDDADEAASFKEAWVQLSADARVSHITYCMEVLWLLKAKRYDMVFLRVDTESKNGIFFLQTIRALKELKALPVIMYSTALNDCYVDRCYKAKANYYLQKQETTTDTLHAFSRHMSMDLKKQKRLTKSEFLV